MKGLCLFLFFALTALCFGEKPFRQMPGHRSHSDSPWLGVRLKRLEKETAAQLHEVPAGFGLLIDSVEPDSPASDAGLQSLDVLWKYDDQLLVNKGQLFALMRKTGVGKEGGLTVSRAGESLVLPALLSTRPESQEDLAKGAAEALMPPLPGAILRQLDLGKRSGFIKEGGLTVSLSKGIDGYTYQVSQGEKVLEQGKLQGEGGEAWPETIDEKTHRKLEALLQSLNDAEQREAITPRQPRVRRVPVPKPEEKE